MTAAVSTSDSSWSNESPAASGFHGTDSVETPSYEAPQFPRVVRGANPMPLLALRKYAKLMAYGHATTKEYEDGSWWAEAAECPGTFGEGSTESDAVHDLIEVIYEWAMLKIEDHDRDFAVIPGAFDLNTI